MGTEQSRQKSLEQNRQKSLGKISKSSSVPLLNSSQQTAPISPKDLLKKAISAVEQAAELPENSLSTRLRVNSQCDLAASDVQDKLDERKDHLGKLVSDLQLQREEAEKTIGDAEKRIVKLKRHAQNTMLTPRSSKTTEDQLSSAEAMLVELKSLKGALEGDLSNKYAALKIDESCRQLTRIKSGRHKSKVSQTMRKIGKDGVMRDTAGQGMMPRMPPAS